MLLPSVFQCEAPQPKSNTRRPKLLSYATYIPTQVHESPLQSSCRALQAILGGSAVAPQRLSTPVPRSYAQESLSALRTPLQPKQHNARAVPRGPSNLKSVLLPAQTPRSSTKRRRTDYEQENPPNDNKMDIDIYDEASPQTQDSPEGSRYQTPKRRSHIPIRMPLGLTALDFASLPEPDELDVPSLSHSSSISSSDSSETDADSVWTPEDDVLLVQTVLEKLKLSHQQWNDCATVLGKDKDSLGRRWRLLIDEGGVGLRRGVGRMERGRMEWDGGS